MKKGVLLILLMVASVFSIFAEKATLSGYIKDGETGEALIGATVIVADLQTGVATNEYGFFSLTLEQGTYNIEVSFIGYDVLKQQINLNESMRLSFDIKQGGEKIEEVVVSGEREDQNVESVEMSVEKLEVNTVKKLPAFMGEVDIIKTIQLLPGIQSGGEGSSGLYVRGGGPDENLMLLDEAPVYNASHLFGFFSVFNADAVKDIKVYKGGIPAPYGGRASSVIDIRQKDGNNQKFGMTGGIGSVSSRLALEGPIIKDKWSYLIAGRRTYADIIGRAAGVEQLQDSKLYFYDLNFKSTITVNENNRIYLSAYTGEDVFSFDDAFFLEWGNLTTTGRWNHIFGDKLFMNTSFIYSEYNYNLGVPSGAGQFDWQSEIQDVNFKLDFTYYLNPKNQLKFGVNAIYHRFRPGKIEVGDESFFNNLELTNYRALESALYVSNEQEVTDRIKLIYGLRLSHFQGIGKGVERIYADPNNLSKDEIIEVREYDSFERMGDPYIYFEPRFGANYRLNTQSSIKLSYNRMVQNLHLISNTNSPTPLDIWLPTSKYIKPLIVDQVAAGYFRNFKDNMYETSVEVFYKNMQNVLDYIDGAELFLREEIETELRTGKGNARGVEFMVRKNKGKLTGWIGYTWSRSVREVDGVNNGEQYVASYNRPHDLSVVGTYKLNKYWDISTTFVYATGNPVTYPIGSYEVYGVRMLEYAARNENNLPDYHRLDLSLTYDFKKNEKRRFKQSLNISFFNVYARRNAYSITFGPDVDNEALLVATRTSIIGSVIPAITYNFKF